MKSLTQAEVLYITVKAYFSVNISHAYITFWWETGSVMCEVVWWTYGSIAFSQQYAYEMMPHPL